jgi:dTDP-3-amino-3,4,6-trideoxy-alpha-D-glucose transaminase
VPDPVPFVDLARDHEPLRDELRAAFERVVDASAFILGEEVEGFEHEFAAACGAAHCVGVASGTAALTLMLEAAGIGAGDEVVVPAHTYTATVLGVLHAGARPAFCDVHDGSGLMDPGAAAAAIGERTAALLPVHLYGQACDMDALGQLAARRGLALFEDAAQAHGAGWRGRPAGSLGTAAAFSFYPSKNLGALGDGGAICTSDDGVAARARELRDIGQRAKGRHVVAGYNERLDGLQAALLRVKLPHLGSWNEARRRLAAAYREALPPELRLLEERPESPCVYHLFPVRIDARDELAAGLAAAGVRTGVHYSPAAHRQPYLDADPGSFPNAEAWAREELSLPIFPSLRREELDRVVASIASRWPPASS